VTYLIKEAFYSIQGEGAQSGRPAIFCRFAGCNLWSGKEEDRADAQCRFCDTDFHGTDGDGGGVFEVAEDLVQHLLGFWPSQQEGDPFVVLTGGEPALQLDRELIDVLHAHRFEIAIETNGTMPLPSGLDWTCVSPKAGTTLSIRTGNELKLVYPQRDLDPESFAGLEFGQWFLQPMDGPDLEENTRSAMDYCLRHPLWKVSLQTHKILGVR